MNRNILLLLAILALFTHLEAQINITLNGTAANGAGKHIYLYRYSDMLTLSEVQVSDTVIAENGHFRLSCYANYPCMMVLQVENYSQSFFVEPGRDYEIYIPSFDWTIDERKNVFLDPEVLPVEFLDMPADDLNALITHYEAAAAEYIDSHLIYFDPRFRPQKRYYDSLVAFVDKRLPDSHNEYFLRYKRFQLAQFQYGMQFTNRAKAFSQFVSGQPILYYDDNYMSFFFTLFSHSISDGTRKIPVWQMASWVNNVNVGRMLDSLAIDTILRNEQICELVALQGLYEAFSNRRYYDPHKVEQCVVEIAERTKFVDHKHLAQHILAAFHSQQQGYVLPSFCLPDADRNMQCLDSLRGKWVYLAFVRVDDPNSLGEIETMAHFKDTLYAQYPDLRFVTICCDREFQKMYHLLRNSRKGYRYTWQWLHFNGDYTLLEHYGVVSYPHFILLDPEGQQCYDVTPQPASGFLLHGPWQPQSQSTRRDDEASFLR